jgi:hypothetical protein
MKKVDMIVVALEKGARPSKGPVSKKGKKAAGHLAFHKSGKNQAQKGSKRPHPTQPDLNKVKGKNSPTVLD